MTLFKAYHVEVTLLSIMKKQWLTNVSYFYGGCVDANMTLTLTS